MFGNCFGGNNCWWIIILLVILFCGCGNGNTGTCGGCNNYPTNCGCDRC